MKNFYLLLFSLLLSNVLLTVSRPRYTNNSPPPTGRGYDTPYNGDDPYDPNDSQYDPNYDPNRTKRSYRDEDEYADPRGRRYRDRDPDYNSATSGSDAWYDTGYENSPPDDRGQSYATDDRSQPRAPRTRVPPQKRIVEKYTKSLPSLVLVACSSSVFVYLASTMLLNFMLSNAPLYATLALAAAGFLATYVPGEAGTFSRSSGVFLLLLAQRASLHAFLGRLVRQLLALIKITRRAGFPSLEDPWRYRPRGPKDIDFNMTSVMIASVLLGGLLGWSIGRSIPLLPTWIGTLTGVGFLAYFCTLQDTVGDLIRFLSYSVAESYGEVVAASREVGLTDEVSVLLGRALNLFKLLDRKFQLIPKLQAIFAFVMSKITEVISRIRQQESVSRSDGPAVDRDARRDDY